MVSSISEEGKPRSAAINYVIDDDFNLFFLTKVTSKKNINIQYSNNVALTVFEEGYLPVSAQVEGIAEVIDEAERKIEIQKALMDRLWEGPYLPPILKQPGWGTALVKVAIKKVKWFRLQSDSKTVQFEYLDL